MHFDHVIFSAIPRACNRVAHELARIGLSRDPDLPSVLEDPLPDFVTTLVGRWRFGDIGQQAESRVATEGMNSGPHGQKYWKLEPYSSVILFYFILKLYVAWCVMFKMGLMG